MSEETKPTYKELQKQIESLEMKHFSTQQKLISIVARISDICISNSYPFHFTMVTN